MQENYDDRDDSNSDIIVVFQNARYKTDGNWKICDSGFLHQKIENDSIVFFMESSPYECGELLIKTSSVEVYKVRTYNLSIHPTWKYSHSPRILSKSQKTQIADSSLFRSGGGYFPTERNQSLTWAYTGQQGRLFVLHYVDHQLYAKSKSGDEHIPLWDGGYVGDALGEFFEKFLLLVGEGFP